MSNQKQKIFKYFFPALAFSSLLVVVAVEGLVNKRTSFDISELIPEVNNTELHSGFEESNETPLFSSNPMELLDAWRRSTAMEDATAPSDALDEAIKAFENKELVNSSNDR